MKVEELARSDVVTVGPDATVAEIAETMFHRKVGCVVVAEDDDIEGIITDRDLVIELFAEDSHINVIDGDVPLGDISARDLMTTDPLTVGPDDEMATAIAQMNDAITRRLPVVEDGSLVGIVTLDDFLVHFAGDLRRYSADLAAITDVIRAESPPP